jgi:hypothetical protein
MKKHNLVITSALLLLSAGSAGAQIIDHSNPATGNDDLVANQNYPWGPIFVGGLCRLTDKGQGETASVYFRDRVNISRFQNSFVFQIISGASGDPSDGSGNVADGFTFIIQNQGLDALGGGGGELGSSAIAKSVAIKFDPTPNSWDGLADPSISSTGIFAHGSRPGGGIDLLPEGINLRSGHPFRVDMDYNGAVLTVRITDEFSGASALQKYRVDIPAIVGGKTAYVGFTGATGLGTAAQDLLKWYYASEPLLEHSSPVRLTHRRGARVNSRAGMTVAAWPTRALSARSVVASNRAIRPPQSAGRK